MTIFLLSFCFDISQMLPRILSSLQSLNYKFTTFFYSIASATSGSSGGLSLALLRLRSAQALSTLSQSDCVRGAFFFVLSRSCFPRQARDELSDGLRGFARLRLALGFLPSSFNLASSFLLSLRPHGVLQKVFIRKPYPIFSFDKLRTGEPRRFADIEQFPRGAVGFSRVTSLPGLLFFPYFSLAFFASASSWAMWACSTGVRVRTWYLRYSSRAFARACWAVTEPAFWSTALPPAERMLSSIVR